jgi:hypothetical protein
MPLASQTTIDRVMNVLLNGNHAMKQAVLRTTPINPPNGATSMFTHDQLYSQALNFAKLKITSVDDMVCFLKLKAVERDQVGAMTFETKFARELPLAADRIGWVPCWFLPWSSGRIIKLKIPSVATTPVINFTNPAIAPIGNPGLFFTAGINGCSVFAVGTPDAPSVYHGGINPGSGLVMPLQPNETTEAAWRRLLGRAGTVKFVGSVGKTDYISELNNPATSVDSDRVTSSGAKTTRLAAALEATLQLNGALTNVSVSPWGAVFGLREPANGHWSMCLVQNSTVTYQRVVRTVKKRFLRSDKVITMVTGEDRGLLVNYPISNSYNLGHKEFFPGVGVAVVRNLDTTQIF